MTRLLQDETQTHDSKGLSREALDALRSLDQRLRSCFSDPITVSEAYDSFYQEIVAETIAKLTASIGANE